MAKVLFKISDGTCVVRIPHSGKRGRGRENNSLGPLQCFPVDPRSKLGKAGESAKQGGGRPSGATYWPSGCVASTTVF